MILRFVGSELMGLLLAADRDGELSAPCKEGAAIDSGSTRVGRGASSATVVTAAFDDADHV